MYHQWRKTIRGDNKPNEFEPHEGSDTIFGMGGADVIEDGKGASRDFFYGGNGDDLIFTRGGADRIYGENGDDVVVAKGSGNFRADGGDGYDVLHFIPPWNKTTVFDEINDEKTVIEVRKHGHVLFRAVVTDFEKIDYSPDF